MVNEALTETGGDSLGISTLHTNTAYSAISAGKAKLKLTNGKTVNPIQHGRRADATRATQLSQFLKMYAGQAFIFTAPMRQAVLHIIEFVVEDIALVKAPVVDVVGIWTDLRTGVQSQKHIKVDTQTGAVTFYDPNSHSSKAVLNTKTRTSTQWDAFVVELRNFVRMLANSDLANLNK